MANIHFPLGQRNRPLLLVYSRLRVWNIIIRKERKNMNKLSKKLAAWEGFTLVELIVVIAILGILAGIAIPVYSGYISKAQEAADMQTLDSIKTAAVFATVDANNAAVVDKIEVTGCSTAGSIVVKVNGASDATDVSAYIGTGAKFNYVTQATWRSDAQAATDSKTAGWTVDTHK